MSERTLDAAELARLRKKIATSLLDALEKARGETNEAREAVAFQNKVIVSGTIKLNEARAERDAARALLREVVPHIERALVPYKDGWIEEKADILKRIAAESGEW